jgi:hypothetical protein
VKWINHRLTGLFRRSGGPPLDGPPPEASSPVGLALFACVASFGLVVLLARPWVALLSIWWIELWVYSLIPVALTFIILYRSTWCPEITGVARTCSLLLLSCAILGGIILAIGLLLALGCFFVLGLKSDLGP